MSLYFKKKQIVICNFNLGGEIISPEIGKNNRPVIIIHAHKRMRSVIALPMTSQNPENKKGHYVHVPKEQLFGDLKNKDSWVICDMVYHLSYKRLTKIYDKASNTHLHPSTTKLSDEIFAEVIRKVRGLF